MKKKKTFTFSYVLTVCPRPLPPLLPLPPFPTLSSLLPLPPLLSLFPLSLIPPLLPLPPLSSLASRTKWDK